MARQPEARQTHTQAAFAAALGAQLRLLQPAWAALERSLRDAAPDTPLLLWLDLQLQVHHSGSGLYIGAGRAGWYLRCACIKLAG